MPVSEWNIQPPHISLIHKGFQQLPASVITPETHIKLETGSPDCEIFFSTDGSIPDPLCNNDVLSATKSYRYKNPFKLKPGTRTVKTVSVSRLSGATSAASSKTFDVVEPHHLEKKHYTSDTQIYANSKYQGGDTFRVPDMNHRNQHESLYDDARYTQLRSSAPRTPYIDPVSHQRAPPPSVDPEVSEFFSTHNTQHRIASLPATLNTGTQKKSQLYDDVRQSAPYFRNGEPSLNSQGHRMAQSSTFESHKRSHSPTTFQGHRRAISPTDPGRKSPAYESRRREYLESQKAVHENARRKHDVSERFQEETRTRTLETDEDELLAELERKYEAEKAHPTVEEPSDYDDVTPRYSDIIGLETSRLLESARVRFEEDSYQAKSRLEQDMRQRDALADLTGNQLRYSTRSRSKSRSRSRSPSGRSTQYRATSQPREDGHMLQRQPPATHSDREKLERLLAERESARSRTDLESLTDLENEIEAYRRSMARQRPSRSRSRSLSPQRRDGFPSNSPSSSDLDNFFSERHQELRRNDRMDSRVGSKGKKGEKGPRDKAETERMEKAVKKDKDKSKDKSKKDKKNKSESESSDSDSSSSSKSSSSTSSSSDKSEKSGKKDKKKEKREKGEKEKKKDKKDEKDKDKKREKSSKESRDEKSTKDEEKLVPKSSTNKPVPKTPKSAATRSRDNVSVTPRKPSMPATTPRTGRIDTSRSDTSIASSVKPVKQAVKAKAVQKKDPVQADSALNFMNDSGTQINFWGAPPKEILDSMKGMFPKVKPATAALPPPGHQNGLESPTMIQAKHAGVLRSSRGMTQQHIEESVDSDSEHSELSDWFSPTRGAAPGYRPQQQQKQGPFSTLKPSSHQPKSTPAQKKPLLQTAPAKLIADDSPSITGPGPVSATKQTEQESIGGFFKKLFKKGWGSSEKSEKSKDPRQTVRAVGDDSGVTYQQLKSKVVKKGHLFEDTDFPCENKSLYFSGKPVSGEVEWKRPHEICSNPEMFVGGASRFDIMQGVLGNCWLLAAMASLTTDQKLLYKVVPPDQSFNKEYAGIFRFCMWQYGQWVEVTIDDRLPTYKGKLIYMHSTESNEFWSPLLEKAYAKLVGCYENLTGGLQSEAMTDFTGGVCERYNFREEMPDNMFQILYKARQRGAMMGCSIDAGTFKAQSLPGKTEEELENGLIVGHAYSITDVKQLESNRGVVQLVRCRNPWGTEHEWNGAWSDQSPEWQNISEKAKKELGLHFEHDGEFWMEFRDFSANFQRVEVCNLSPDDILDDKDDHIKWKCQTLSGCWKKKANAGGCRNFPKTFHSNPQYRVELIDVDDDDDEDIATMIVALMQKGRRRLKESGQGNLTVGYEIYDVSDASSGNLGSDFFRKHGPVASAPQYINMREVVGRHRLPPATYCIIPTTFEPNEEADFVIRIFTESEAGEVTESDEATCFVQPKTSSVVQSSAHLALTSQAEEQFNKHGGEDEEIDASELRDILNEVFTKDFKHVTFDMALCKSLLSSKDTDGHGTLSREEFDCLWNDLTKWKNTFKEKDVDNSGHFNGAELRDALGSLGFTVTNATFRKLVTRYSDKEGCVTFDDFVGCLVSLEHNFGTFHSKKTDSEEVQFNLDEFVQMTTYS